MARRYPRVHRSPKAPGTAEALAALWDKGLPVDPSTSQPFHLYQQEDLIAFIPQNADYWDTGATNRWADFLRLYDFKEISPLVRNLSDRVSLDTPPVQSESEWLLGRGARLEVARIQRDEKRHTVYVTLRYPD